MAARIHYAEATRLWRDLPVPVSHFQVMLRTLLPDLNVFVASTPSFSSVGAADPAACFFLEATSRAVYVRRYSSCCFAVCRPSCPVRVYRTVLSTMSWSVYVSCHELPS